MTEFAAPRKRLGQHFLHDQSVVERMVRAFKPKADQHVIEIGPGRGVLTQVLTEYLSTLTVIELDHVLAQWLENESPMRERLVVHQGDALKFDYDALTRQSTPLRIIGNLPYQISSPLLFKLLTLGCAVHDMCFMLQKEFVDRILAQPGASNYGRLTVMTGRYSDSQRLFNVSRGAFTPPPKVESAIIHIYPRTPAPLDDTLFADLVRQAFSARRKTLRNGLKGLATVQDIQRAGVDPGSRPDTVSVEQFESITRAIRN